MTPRLCSRCQQITYPDRWCECDPRWQMDDFLLEECVYLQPDQSEELEGG